MSSGPRTAEKDIICGTEAAPNGRCTEGNGGAITPGRVGIWSGANSEWRLSLLVSLCTRRRTPLMDLLDRCEGFFLDSAFRLLGVGERLGSGELLEDSSSSAGGSLS